jgi:hypothetical protein
VAVSSTEPERRVGDRQGGRRGVTCADEYEPWEHDLDGRAAEERQTFGCGVDREDDP